MSLPFDAMEKTDLKNFTQQKLNDFAQELGLPAFRAKQIFAWLYRPAIESFSQMTDLSLELREKLNETCRISSLHPTQREESQDGTIKYGFELEDGFVIESVLIPEEDRNTLCVSSQVGCAMGCTFCLTATMGFKRNLTPAEMVNQVIAVIEDLRQKDKAITNLVFMGMGEPLANFDNLIDALEILINQRGLDFSSRRITVSTCGLIPKMLEMGDRIKVNLAVSLHAPDDETRNRLMPVNQTYPLADLLQACRDFPLPNRRRIMIEYIMLKDLNDSDQDAELLAHKLRGIPCKINLLAYNQTDALDFEPSSPERIKRFQEILRRHDYTVLLRSSRGADISAACGQLAAKSTEPLADENSSG